MAGTVFTRWGFFKEKKKPKAQTYSEGKGVFKLEVKGATIIVGDFELKILFCKTTQGLTQAWVYHFLGFRFAKTISYFFIILFIYWTKLSILEIIIYAFIFIISLR